MPTTPRKSSLGGVSRRGPLKAHIPYRGDNPEVGKKTGIAVQHVQRQSDGFEPFEQIMQQADGRTPPRPKGRKKSLTVAAHQDDDDGDDGGEESMQLDSPVQHLANMRPAVSPAKSHRTPSSVRPVARTSNIDFDKIPSPRPNNTSFQRNARNSVPGPSRASNFTRIHEPEPDTGSPDPGNQSNEMGPDPFDNYSPQESPSPNQVSPRRKSFSRIEEDQGDDEGMQEEEAEFLQETPSKRKKDKGRQLSEEPDQDIEDEIAQELENVGFGPDSEDDEEVEQERRPPVKKAKADVKNPQRTQTQSKTKKENRSPREGVRRSQREHYRPLEYWRGEKLVYGRTRNSGPILVPQIKEIIRIPKEVPVPLGSKRKRGTTRPRSQSKALEAAEDVIPPALPVVNPEEGWDDKTEAKCTVIHFTSKEEVDRRIAWTARMVEPQLAANHSWSFDKIFGDDDFIAAGQLIIPPKGRKPSKAAKDNTYVFYVIEGAVNFKIHNTSMILATGGMFMVPRGNTYFIENICDRDAKLFFTQARKVEMSEEESATKAGTAAELQRRKSALRSSSAGAPSTTSKLPTPNGRAASTAVG